LRPSFISIMKWTLAGSVVAALAVLLWYLHGWRRRSSGYLPSTRNSRPKAIIVLGAAEYHGRPSPVLEGRLNHALFLYLKGLLRA